VVFYSNEKILCFKLSLAQEDRRNRTKLYNPRSIKDLEEILPSIKWLDYFNTFLTQKDQITEDEIIILSDESTFVKLHQLLESTPKRYLV
jgi:neprilysin